MFLNYFSQSNNVFRTFLTKASIKSKREGGWSRAVSYTPQWNHILKWLHFKLISFGFSFFFPHSPKQRSDYKGRDLNTHICCYKNTSAASFILRNHTATFLIYFHSHKHLQTVFLGTVDLPRRQIFRRKVVVITKLETDSSNLPCPQCTLPLFAGYLVFALILNKQGEIF